MAFPYGQKNISKKIFQIDKFYSKKQVTNVYKMLPNLQVIHRKYKKTIESYISFKKIKFCRKNQKLFDAKKSRRMETEVLSQNMFPEIG